jgi:hypothetical protein
MIMPHLDSPMLGLEILALSIIAAVEFVSLLQWRIRIHHALPRQRNNMILFTISDLLVGCGLLILFPLVYKATWLTLFEQYPLLVGMILIISLLLLTAGIGKALLLLFTHRPAVPKQG